MSVECNATSGRIIFIKFLYSKNKSLLWNVHIWIEVYEYIYTSIHLLHHQPYFTRGYYFLLLKCILNSYVHYVQSFYAVSSSGFIIKHTAAEQEACRTVRSEQELLLWLMSFVPTWTIDRKTWTIDRKTWTIDRKRIWYKLRHLLSYRLHDLNELF